MDMEDEWKQYPVIRLNMSRGGASAEYIESYLDVWLSAPTLLEDS